MATWLHGYRAMRFCDYMANPNPNPLHRRLCSAWPLLWGYSFEVARYSAVNKPEKRLCFPSHPRAKVWPIGQCESSALNFLSF